MADTNHITTQWKGETAFESNNPSGHSFPIDSNHTSENKSYSPKALMLSALAGCSGLDVASLIKKMKLEVDDFKIETIGKLTDEHPKYYNKVAVEYHFYGTDLNEEKLKKAVNLSVDKYCGVMEMFRKFSEIEIKTIFHNK